MSKEFSPVPRPEGFDEQTETEPTGASVKDKVKARPTETVAGLGLAAAVYGFLTQADLANPVAGVIAVVVAFAPALISQVVDQVRAKR
jgi:hypothetical protein